MHFSVLGTLKTNCIHPNRQWKCCAFDTLMTTSIQFFCESCFTRKCIEMPINYFRLFTVPFHCYVVKLRCHILYTIIFISYIFRCRNENWFCQMRRWTLMPDVLLNNMNQIQQIVTLTRQIVNMIQAQIHAIVIIFQKINTT